MHSATKDLAGHSDLLAGAVVGPEALLERIDAKGYLGASPDPFAAFLLARSLKTLSLRVARQNENGRRVADALARHPAVRRVFYPGRNRPEEEEIAARQMRGRGGMLSISLRAGPGPSTRSCADCASSTSPRASAAWRASRAFPPSRPTGTSTPEELAERGIDGSMVRLSFGVEEPEDLVRDLTEALDALGSAPAPPL